MAERPGSPRTFWTGSALFARWQLTKPWAVAVRPEFYWDRNGRQTGFEQFVTAITTTLEYRILLGVQTLIRVEHRYDDSTGAQGGFFYDGNVAPGEPRLARDQHLLFLSLIWSFDS
jgi:Putative beta-barrel porin-2, OmpL-like. bbp2